MEFKSAMTEWITLKTQLSSARQDLKVLNQREKELRGFVTRHMAQNEIDTVKVQDKIKVNLKNKTVRGSITKDVIRKGLSDFFGGNEAQVDGALQAIQDAAPTKQVSSVSVTGLKA